MATETPRDRPRATINKRWLLLLLALVAIGAGIYRLRFNAEVLDLLPAGEPVVEGLKLFQQNFANARELIITVRALEAEAAEQAARTLAERLRRETNLVLSVAWEPPWLEHPDQSAELLAYLWLNQQPSAFAELTNRLSPTNLPSLLQNARERLAASFSPDDVARLSYDPFGLSRLPESATGTGASFGEGQELFASSDGRFRMIFVEAREDLPSYRDCAKWLGKIQQIIHSQTNDLPANVSIKYTGRPAFVAEIGSGMQNDMGAPSVGTLVIIALLFYISHRRWRPLLWLIVLLIVILASSLALGGLVYGTLNVVSLGFASILLGLAEDFGIVLYEEWRTHPQLAPREVRKIAAPGVFWSAVTTCGAFLLLNLSGMPGLGQLGTLVAIGIALAAIVMLYFYLPPLVKKTPPMPSPSPLNGERAGVRGETVRLMSEEATSTPHFALDTPHFPLAWAITLLLLLGGAGILFWRAPRLDKSPDALKPKNSQAYAALDEVKAEMNRTQEPLWVVVEGQNEQQVEQRLKIVEPILAQAKSNGIVQSYTLPGMLWPSPEHQQRNRPSAQTLVQWRDSFHNAASAEGFATNSLGLADGILKTWQNALQTRGVFWPTNENSEWILSKLTARTPNKLLAVGLIHLATNAPSSPSPPREERAGERRHSLDDLRTNETNRPADSPSPLNGERGETVRLADLSRSLGRDGIWLSGWDLLGPTVSRMVIGDLPRVVIPMMALIITSLWLAFRNWREVFLSLATLVAAGLLLELLMSILGWSWNMMNIMAVPLLLGMGVDFAIHIQLALRRDKGDVRFVRGTIGRALLLAGTTTVAGFGSLAFASNAGMASLGKVCGSGIACSMVVAVYLLPAWWTTFRRREVSS